MSISFEKLFKDIASSKYNKSNILYYFLIMTLLYATLLVCTLKLINGSYSWYIGLYLFFVLILFQAVTDGYIAIASNNEINQKSDVFPSLKNIDTIFFTGFKLMCGIFVITLAVYFIPYLIGSLSFIYLLMYLYNAIVHTITPSIPFSVNYLLIAFAGLIVCAVSLLLLSYFVIVPLKLGFYRTLDLKDLFDFKKASVLRCEKKKLYFEYFLCLIIIGALTGAMASILGQFGQIVSVIASFFACAIQVLLIPNLNGQIINKNIDDVDEDDSAYDENDEYYEDEEYYDDTNG